MSERLLFYSERTCVRQELYKELFNAKKTLRLASVRGKKAIFAYSDAEAPLSVFLFHRLFIFRGGKGEFIFPPRFLLRKKISIIFLITKYFGLIYTKKEHCFCPPGSILDRLMDFASSVPDFRRLDKGNIRHRLDDIIMLMILGRASKCVGRAEIIEFGRHNLNKFRKMGMLMNGVPSEPTLCRVEKGINDLDLADRMQACGEQRGCSPLAEKYKP